MKRDSRNWQKMSSSNLTDDKQKQRKRKQSHHNMGLRGHLLPTLEEEKNATSTSESKEGLHFRLSGLSLAELSSSIIPFPRPATRILFILEEENDKPELTLELSISCSHFWWLCFRLIIISGSTKPGKTGRRPAWKYSLHDLPKGKKPHS